MFQTAIRRVRRAVIRAAVITTASIGILEVTTELPSKGRASWFYHYVSDEYGTRFMRQVLGPETAHTVAIQLAVWGLSPRHRPNAVEQYVTMRQSLFPAGNHALQFDNPIGLAAGFDKDGQVIQPMFDLGFGFVEIGTVTPQPQEGNPKPRMFRLTHHKAIINRYGFNSPGATVVAQNLKKHFQQQPQQQQPQQQQQQPQQGAITQTKGGGWTWERVWWNFYDYCYNHVLLERQGQGHGKSAGPIGVNIGKNKLTPLDQAAVDYVTNIQTLGSLADYLVLNVSSPNTPGLRDLQHSQTLRDLLLLCLAARNALDQPKHGPQQGGGGGGGGGGGHSPHFHSHRPPLLVKLSPDLTNDELEEIAQVCLEVGIDGIVITNTTNQRPLELLSGMTTDSNYHDLIQQEGGLSGKPLQQRSTELIRLLFRCTQGRIPIVGVGGIFTGRDAYDKLRAGASLVQIYSCLVYQGPGTVSRMRHELALLLRDNGYKSIQDVIGRDHENEEWFWELQKLQLQQQQQLQEASAPPKGLESAVQDW